MFFPSHRKTAAKILILLCLILFLIPGFTGTGCRNSSPASPTPAVTSSQASTPDPVASPSVALTPPAGSTASPASSPGSEIPPAKALETFRELSRRSDWWAAAQLASPAIEPGLRAGRQGQNSFEPELVRLAEAFRKGDPRSLGKLRKYAQSGKADERCWALEILGRLENPGDIPVFLTASKDKDWKVRASSMGALGRVKQPDEQVRAALREALKDEEKFVLRQDKREIGRGGVMEYFLPVVLAAERGLILSQDRGNVEALLEGLRTHPCVHISYDSTPEPFPDTVTETLPSWFPEGASPIILQSGKEAVPFLLKALDCPDTTFSRTSGGLRAVNTINTGLATTRSTPLPPTYHAYIVYHLDRICDSAECSRLMLEQLGQEGKSGGNILSALGEKVTDDRVLKILVKNTDDSSFLRLIRQKNALTLRSGINKKLITTRLIEILKKPGEDSAYVVPVLLGEIEDPAVVDALLSVLPVKDGGDSLVAENRASSAIRSLGIIGNEKALKALENLETIGDCRLDEYDTYRRERDDAVKKLREKLKK